ncbi:M28 family metallopeptidase [Pseudidiomarina andamanensis]|uniref:M20/M25/M40 family metallo-hydrolase n=1 Tax=Pseudidiomarina andamanensis TaxID=1940690 RepID=A0AA92ER98_9GAMM|nr:M28 family metallopeptidase [Pseudidiomarina andamanensis]MDS0218388.1 M28 family metallopeptidase [Pseudidiomarina andamanensis]QGT95272.1 M20/M25/M40 family metallo-hydrolase [Pseudidiomarina andamanensis]
MKLKPWALLSSVAAGVFAISAYADVEYTDQPQLHAIQQAVSADRIQTDIEKLVSFGTRHTLSETESDTRGIGAARRWIKAEFDKISAECGGCLEVYYQSRVISGEPRIPDPVEVVSVIAVQKGTVDPSRYVIMSGDIDSRVSDVMDYTSDAPGANDNASGVAGTLEAARVLSKYKFAGSIVYAALAGEEQGLFGGKIMAEQAQKDGWRIKAVLNNDMIGNIEGINGVINNTTARIFAEGTRQDETPEDIRRRRFTGGEVDSPSRNVARYIDWMADRYIPNLDTMVIYRLDRFARGGHHRPFNDLGFPGVRIMETNENYNRQHQDLRVENGIAYGDTIDGVDFDYAAKLTALNAVSLASMAWAPSPPAEVKIAGAVSPSTTLSWAAPSEAEKEHVKGYRIYWRHTDAPNWEFSRYVGNVTEYTLENIVIDNYFFGVASVSDKDFESPVVYPGAAGAFGE